MWATGEQIFSLEDTMTYLIFICFIIVFILLKKSVKVLRNKAMNLLFSLKSHFFE